MVRHRIKSTAANSSKLGACEVCGKHATEVFIQSEERSFLDDGVVAWTRQGTQTLFGHRECLLAERHREEVLSA
jgi:hypothetical protein